MTMLVDGKTVGLLTGTDVEAMKKRLHSGHFHLPLEQSKKPRK